ncbi:MAG: DUF2752 domain-containing protein, partial [Planctomycetota bacterium]|nr:DUF2752 domain-containing protein [Planctomycetota bacterium]
YDDRVPEEVNRRVIDHCSTVLMPYTERSRANLIREGIPCPGCGVTTAMSAGAHGRLALAARSQAGGLALLAATVALGAAGAVQALTGRAALRPFALHRWGWWLIGGTAAVLGGWGLKLALGYASGEYPLH